VRHLGDHDTVTFPTHPAGSLAVNLLANAAMKYFVAWLLGVPLSVIAAWFVINQIGC
jgi:hypothetical protein